MDRAQACHYRPARQAYDFTAGKEILQNGQRFVIARIVE
jgi:hypothetical protein